MKWQRTIGVYALLLMLNAAAASADPITINTLTNDPNASSGGFWIGTWDISAVSDNPDPLVTYQVAQSFQTYADFVGVTGFVDLQHFGQRETIPRIVFGLTAGLDQASFSEVAVDVRPEDGVARYTLDFGSVSLQDGVTYWLTARSDNVFVLPNAAGSGAVGTWNGSAGYAGDMAYQRDNDAWLLQRQSMAFYLDGTRVGDSVANGSLADIFAPPPVGQPQPVPEPSTLLFLSIGAAAFISRKRN